MKVSPKVDYAFIAILELGFHYPEGRIVSVADIARKYSIPLPFLEQVMLTLKRAGYMTSKKGKKGGFLLTRAPAEITLGEIFRVIQGPIGITECSGRDTFSSCPQILECAFRDVWQDVSQAIFHILDRVTFSDMMRKAEELRAQRSESIYYI